MVRPSSQAVESLSEQEVRDSALSPQLQAFLDVLPPGVRKTVNRKFHGVTDPDSEALFGHDLLILREGDGLYDNLVGSREEVRIRSKVDRFKRDFQPMLVLNNPLAFDPKKDALVIYAGQDPDDLTGRTRVFRVNREALEKRGKLTPDHLFKLRHPVSVVVTEIYARAQRAMKE